MTGILKIITLQNGSFEENAYLIYRQGSSQGILIDPGSSSQDLAKACEALGVKPALLLATHGHVDHIGAVEDLKERWGIRFAAHSDEDKVMLGATVFGAMFGVSGARRPHIDLALADGQTVEAAGISLKVVHTPGHSPGSVCYWHAETRDLFSGDTLFEDSVGRQDLPGGDSQAIRRSLLEKVYTLPEDAKVWPGHGAPTSIGKEKYGNPFIRVAK